MASSPATCSNSSCAPWATWVRVYVLDWTDSAPAGASAAQPLLPLVAGLPAGVAWQAVKGAAVLPTCHSAWHAPMPSLPTPPIRPAPRCSLVQQHGQERHRVALRVWPGSQGGNRCGGSPPVGGQNAHHDGE